MEVHTEVHAEVGVMSPYIGEYELHAAETILDWAALGAMSRGEQEPNKALFGSDVSAKALGDVLARFIMPVACSRLVLLLLLAVLYALASDISEDTNTHIYRQQTKNRCSQPGAARRVSRKSAADRVAELVATFGHSLSTNGACAGREAATMCVLGESSTY